MYATDLANMATNPYSREIHGIVNEAMGIFHSKCKDVANRGGRELHTTVQYYDGDYDEWTLDFGNYHGDYGDYSVRHIPMDMRDSVMRRVEEELCRRLREEGFENFTVRRESKGPFFNPLYIFGRRSFLKDKSNPKYMRYISISVTW